MIIKSEFNKETFMLWLIWLAEQEVEKYHRKFYFSENILDIPRDELEKKCSYLYDLLADCYDPETVTEDKIKELINYGNWGDYPDPEDED